MQDLYNYEKNIKMLKGNNCTVICVTDEILTFIENSLHDAINYHENHNRLATADAIKEMWQTIIRKEDEAKNEITK